MLLARKMLLSQNFSKALYTEPGTYSILLTPGDYQFVVRGAGGAGGDYVQTYNSGAGGKGDLQEYTVHLYEPTIVTVYVGSGGLPLAEGGNGGEKGDYTDATNQPEDGGGGGYPSYIKVGNTVYGANGGGGGGGFGGSDNNSSRYSDGGSGGGGGGFYRLNSDGTITSVPGQKGGKGGMQIS